MAEMWYYTTEGKQQDPVTIKELRRLIGEGILKPTDMVWKDGMARWIRASSVKELFPDPNSALDQYFSNGKAELRTVAVPVPVGAAPETNAVKQASAPPADGSDQRPRPIEDDERAPASRRRPPAKSGGSLGIIVMLILGALLLLGALGVGVAILIVVAQDTGGKINPNNLIKSKAEYNIQLAAGSSDVRHFSLRKGVEYEFTVKTQANQKGVDVDLFIHDSRGREMASDIADDPDCRLLFTADRDGEYRVTVTNVINPNRPVVPVQCKVVIREVKQGPPKDEVKDTPLPPGVRESKGLDAAMMIPIGKEDNTKKFRVRAGHKANFTFVPSNPGPKTDFNLIVVNDKDNEVIAQDVGPEPGAKVSFTLPTTEIVTVRIINATPKGPGGGGPRGALSFDVSP
jgi:hypothetical protein